MLDCFSVNGLYRVFSSSDFDLEMLRYCFEAFIVKDVMAVLDKLSYDYGDGCEIKLNFILRQSMEKCLVQHRSVLLYAGGLNLVEDIGCGQYESRDCTLEWAEYLEWKEKNPSLGS